MQILNGLLLDTETVAAAKYGSAVELEHMVLADATASITVANPDDVDFTDADVNDTNNSVTVAGHGLLTGTKVQVSTDDTLPDGLAAATDYYIIKVSSSVFKFATSQANALAGTAIDLLDAGTGNHTVEVNTTVAGSAKLQKTNDRASEDSRAWFDVASSSQNFTGSTTLNWALVDIGFVAVRAVVTVTSGTVTVSTRINAKGA